MDLLRYVNNTINDTGYSTFAGNSVEGRVAREVLNVVDIDGDGRISLREIIAIIIVILTISTFFLIGGIVYYTIMKRQKKR